MPNFFHLYARILSGWNFHKRYACCHKCYEFICAIAILCLKNTFSLILSTSSGSFHLYIPSSAKISETWGEVCNRFVSFKAEHLTVSYLLVDQLRVSVLIANYCKGMVI